MSLTIFILFGIVLLLTLFFNKISRFISRFIQVQNLNEAEKDSRLYAEYKRAENKKLSAKRKQLNKYMEKYK